MLSHGIPIALWLVRFVQSLVTAFYYISMLQAFIFMMLTIVYLSMAHEDSH